MGSLLALADGAPARELALEPGRIIGLRGPPGSGLTRLGLSLLAEPSRRGPVAYIDARGWLCPLAAWEAGVIPERLVVVRCDDGGRWPKVLAALLEGVQAIYAEVPSGVSGSMLRRLGSLVRARRRAVLLRPLRQGLPAGLAHLDLAAEEVAWEGVDAGHGRLLRRKVFLEASGKGVGGIPRVIELEDDGTDTVRMVPGLGIAPAGAVG